MRSYRDIQAQQENVDRGGLKVTVMTADGTRPVENALVKISYTGESGQTIEAVSYTHLFSWHRATRFFCFL